MDCAVVKHFERTPEGMCYTVFNKNLCVYDDVNEIWITTTHLIMTYGETAEDDAPMMRIVSLSDVEDMQIYMEPVIVDNKEES